MYVCKLHNTIHDKKEHPQFVSKQRQVIDKVNCVVGK